ncbi:type II secretion system F family protein [Syntrophobacter fumaroxidans]|uniref:Type II secretion system protein n=1 Tax=Syntrophobacter fumaroxidans (strain DSM 10017 / MPOB) TaxID=335543 RepID=A0LPI3_SYNFM|nr:type II secretion system F family protein [Syntrophobacter fumaroxidans]ABK19335.1 type II secretion system protein [Syntrophobacter fumaroxidans MPOB]
MGYFQYQARDGQGETHRGVLEALSEGDAARKLKSGRLYPVKIKPVKSHRQRRVPEEHLIRFFFDLSDLLSAGLPVDRALGLISSNQTNKVFQRISKGLLEEVQGGSDLSGALAKYRHVFGNLSDHMVRAGEASGTLGPILRRLAEYLEQRRTFRQSLVSSMIYPAILFATSLISMVVLLVYVIPNFAKIFNDLHQKIPPVTQFLLDVGIFLKDYGWALVLAAGVVFFGGRQLYRHPATRGALDRFLFRFPLTRYLVLHSELTRFCRTLGTMIQAGVPLLRALSLGQELLTNTVLKQAISPLYQEIKIGHSMSNFFRSRELFPSRMGTMLRISEEQGNMGEGLLGLGDHFEKELQRRLQRLMTLLEPAVIVVTGLVIGLMVLSMFTAIFGINDIKF